MTRSSRSGNKKHRKELKRKRLRKNLRIRKKIEKRREVAKKKEPVRVHSVRRNDESGNEEFNSKAWGKISES